MGHVAVKARGAGRRCRSASARRDPRYAKHLSSVVADRWIRHRGGAGQPENRRDWAWVSPAEDLRDAAAGRAGAGARTTTPCLRAAPATRAATSLARPLRTSGV